MYSQNPLLTCAALLVTVSIYGVALWTNAKTSYNIAILAWFFFPNWATHLMGISGTPIMAIVQVVLTVAIFLNIMKDRQKLSCRPALPVESFLLKLWVAAFIMQVTFGTYLTGRAFPVYSEVPLADLFRNILNDACVFAFFSFSQILIKGEEDLIKVFKIFSWTGLILALELIMTKFFAPIRDTLGKFTLDDLGVFKSIFLNDIAAVSLYLALSAIVSLYLYHRSRQLLFFVNFLVCVFVTPISLVRSVVIAMSLGFIVYFLIIFRQKMGKVAIALFLVGVSLFWLADTIKNGLADASGNQGMVAKLSRLDSLDSTAVRIGSAIRGLEISAQVFPFGVGPLMERHFLPLKPPRYLDKELIPFVSVSNAFREGYVRTTYANVGAEIQIGVFTILLSYGIPGLIALFVTVILAFRALIASVRVGAEAKFVGVLAAILITFFIFHIHNSTPFIYTLLAPVLHMIFMTEAQSNRQKLSSR